MFLIVPIPRQSRSSRQPVVRLSRTSGEYHGGSLPGLSGLGHLAGTAIDCQLVFSPPRPERVLSLLS